MQSVGSHGFRRSRGNGALRAGARRRRGGRGSMYDFLQRPEVPAVSVEVVRAGSGTVGDCGVAVGDENGDLQVGEVAIREGTAENVDDQVDTGKPHFCRNSTFLPFQISWEIEHTDIVNNEHYGNAEEHRSILCTEIPGPSMRTEISLEISSLRGSTEVQSLNHVAYSGSVPVAGRETTLQPKFTKEIGQNAGKLEICYENKSEQTGVIVDHFTISGEMPKEANSGMGPKEDDFFMPSSRKRKLAQEEVIAAESKMQPASKAKRQQRRLEMEPQQTIVRALPGRKKKATAIPAAGAEELVRENESFADLYHKDARLAAEENARLSAGKPIHPFFVRHRPLQRSNMDVESTVGDDILIEPCLPCHVTHNAEEQVSNSCGFGLLECKSKLKSLEDDDWMCNTLKCKAGFSSFSVSIRECFTFAAPFDQSLRQLLEFLKVSSATSNEVASDASLERLKEKYGWYRAKSNADENIAIKGSPKKNCAQRFSDGALNALWTDLYQPQSSQQVCGNKDSVKLLNDWLYSWRTKILSERKPEGTPEKRKNVKMDSDRGWFQDDSDSDGPRIDINEVQNTLLLTGPVGCGKSAAVYACANEQGFDVIEINASDMRTGARIKHKFGEAFESHGLNKWSCVDTDTKHECADGKFTNARGRSQREQSAIYDKSSTDSLPFPEFQRGKMTLILFEEVDTVFDEDKGFMPALVQLAKTAKRPIILTSNSRVPVLPQLEKIEINFTRPAVEDLVVHACFVCTSSGVPGNPWLIERLVRTCQQDIRKLLTLLQFWGQGFRLSKRGNQWKPLVGSGRNLSYQGCLLKDSVQLCTGIENDLKQPLQVLSGANDLVASQADGDKAGDNSQWLPQALWCFDSDAQYCLLPQLFPLAFPCPLSGWVAEKVSVAEQEAVDIAILTSVQSAESTALLKADLARANRKGKRSVKKHLELGSSKATGIEENRDICCLQEIKRQDMWSTSAGEGKHVNLSYSDDDSKLDCDIWPQNMGESLEQGINDGSSMEGDPNSKCAEFEASQAPAKLKLRGSREFKRLQKVSQNEVIAASGQESQVGDSTNFTCSVANPSDDQTCRSLDDVDLQQNQSPLGTASCIRLNGKGSAGNLDPVRAHWLEVANSVKPSCSKCCHVAALKISCALADFEDTFSCCDVISSIPNSVDDSRNAEVAAQLAHANLQYFAEVSNETMELMAADRETNSEEEAQLLYTGPFHEHNLSRQQTHMRLKEALFFAKTTKGLTQSSFCDYTSYMARIAKVEDLGKGKHLGRRHRRGYPDYLSDLGIPKEGIHALRQLSAFGNPLIH